MIQINRQVLIFVSASFLVGCVSFGPSFEPANSVTPSLANSIAQSSNAEAYNNRGLAKYELGDKQGAIADFRESARLFQQQGNAADYEDAQNRIRKLGG